MKKRSFLVLGASILLVLLLSAFIKIPVSSGEDYYTMAPILGIIIFYNPLVLIIYISIGVFLVWRGLKGIKFV